MKILIPILLLFVSLVLFFFRRNYVQNIENFANPAINSGLTKTSTIAGKSYSTLQFKNPTGIACDAAGNVYVSDDGLNKIIKIDSSNNVSEFPGSDQENSSSFDRPRNIAVDSSGNIYVADYNGNSIRKITTSGLVTTLVSTNKPSSIAISPIDGFVYFSDQTSNSIHKCPPTGAVTATKISGNNTDSNQDGNVLNGGSYSQPRGQMSFDTSGNLYVIDQDLKRVRRLGIGTGGDGKLTTIVSGLNGSSSCALVIDSVNKIIIIGDTTRILTVPLSGGAFTVLTGSSDGYADGSSSQAKFSMIQGLALGPNGELFVVEAGGNLTVRKIVSSSGPVTTLRPGTTGTIANANKNVISCTDPNNENTCKFKWDGISTSNPCPSRGAFFNFDTSDCRTAREELIPAGSNLSQFCKNYEIPNSNLALCQEVTSVNYPPAPENTSNILTRGNPGMNDFKACTSLTSKNCTILYMKNGLMQKTFPCTSNAPIYDFGLQACTKVRDICCGLVPSAATFTDSKTPSACKQRMVVDTITKTSMCSGSAATTTVGNICCASSNKASAPQCKDYWTTNYKWISGRAPPLSGQECPTAPRNASSAAPSNVGSNLGSNAVGNFIDYSQYSSLGSNILMFPEDRISSIFNKQLQFETATSLNKPKNT
jgi:DNA-binding beta-propeller fold protein YncE